MSLHDFMATNRQEILNVSRAALRDGVAPRIDVDTDLEIFFDEVYRALRRSAGCRDSESPLPGKSEAAARIGLAPQRAGVEPAKVPLIFGVIANAIGAVGDRHDLSIGAEEYRVFNQCIDAGVAASIENYWDAEKQRQKDALTESYGYLAHELRSALGNAALAFKLLRTGEVSVMGRTANVLGNNLSRMESLIARTLGSVQLEAERAPQLRRVRVAPVLRQLQASSVPERAIAVVLQLDESLFIMADELLFTSAVSNLLHNALKFTCTGGRVTLRSYTEADEVRVEVEDECGGLPDCDVASLFQPFVSSKQHPGGVGLGLAITKTAVEAMNGSITVFSQPGLGCTFQLQFPSAPMIDGTTDGT